jgi:hypothetical protein
MCDHLIKNVFVEIIALSAHEKCLYGHLEFQAIAHTP